MNGDGSRPDRPVRVVSAVISDAARPDRVLLGVRRAGYTRRHPGVLSTPTLRVPDDLFAHLVNGYAGADAVLGINAVPGESFRVGRGGHYASVHAFVLEALLTRKLGLGSALVAETFAASARPRFVSLDNVEDPLGTNESEWTAMLTYEVAVEAGVAAIPAQTESYSRLVWVDGGLVPAAVASRDAIMLDETLDVVEVCIHGLCIRVAASLLSGTDARTAEWRHDR